jgi:hypothetical protein
MKAEVWRAARYANPQASMTVEALTDREGKQVNRAAEKNETLRCKSFPQRTTISTTSCPEREAHTHESPRRQSSEPVFLNQSK